MALLLADGQLSATSATVLGVGTAERVVAITLHNTNSSVEQTVTLTVTRVGSTARTIFRGKLAGYETFYVNGIPLDPSDTLAGSASSASTVDYIVTVGSGQLSVLARDEDGVPKQSSALEVTLPSDRDIDEGTVQVIGLLEEIRNVLLKI